MSNVLLSYINRADAANLSGGSWTSAGSVTLNNLKNSDLDKVARTVDLASASTRVTADLQANYSIRVVCLPKHNLSAGARWRVRAGIAPMDIEFLTPYTGDSRMTATGGANGTRIDSTGTMVAASAPRVDHDVTDQENGAIYTEDLTNGNWGTSGGAAVLDKETISMPTGSILKQPGGAMLPNTTYVVSVEVKVLSGNADFSFALLDGQSLVTDPTVRTAPKKWKRVWAAITTTANAKLSGGSFQVIKQNGNGVLKLRRWNFSRGTTDIGYRKNDGNRRYRAKGVLIEPAATNQLTNSGDIATATSMSQISFASNVSAAPDGTTSMERATSSGSGASFYRTISVAGNTRQCNSIFFRPVDNVDITLRITWTTGGVTQTVSASFNPSTLVMDATPTGTGSVGVGFCDIDYVGNGVYRAYVSGTGNDAANTNAQAAVIFSQASKSCDFWGWQLEQQIKPTSYVPTTTTTVARTADVLTVSGSDFTGAYNAPEGTLLAEFYVGKSILSNSASTLHDVAMTDSSGNGIHLRLVCGTGSTGTANVIVSSPSWNTSGAAVSPNSVVRTAVAYKQSDWASAVNGGTVETKIQGLITPAPDRFNLTSANAPTYLRRFTYWQRRLSNDQIQAISASGADAVGYTSGWVSSLQMAFDGDVPSDWGSKYNLIAALPSPTLARYVTVDFDDPNNAAGYLELSRLFVGSAINPDVGQAAGMKDSRQDLSSIVTSDTGKEYGTARRRRRQADFELNWMSQDEADQIHEMQDQVGVLGEVVYVPDISDLAYSQRYGGLGTLAELSPIDYPLFNTRAVPIRWKEKF